MLEDWGYCYGVDACFWGGEYRQISLSFQEGMVFRVAVSSAGSGWERMVVIMTNQSCRGFCEQQLPKHVHDRSDRST